MSRARTPSATLSPAGPPAGETPVAALATAAAPVAKARRGRPPGSATGSGARAAARRQPAATAQAKTTAAVILETLTGMRSAPEAARTLAVTLARYYALEAQAMAGLLSACEPSPPGPAPGVAMERALSRLREEHRRQSQELVRLRAVVRITQRSLGVAPVSGSSAASAASTAGAGTGKRRRHRRPVVRALTVVRKLQEAAAASPPAAVPLAPDPASTTPVGLDRTAGEPVGG